MKKLIYIVGCLLVLSNSSMSAAIVEDPSVVIVRGRELGIRPTITIVRGSGEPEVTRVKSDDFLVAYRQVIADLYTQGYVLQSSISFGDGPIGVSTFIFVKAAAKP